MFLQGKVSNKGNQVISFNNSGTVMKYLWKGYDMQSNPFATTKNQIVPTTMP